MELGFFYFKTACKCYSGTSIPPSQRIDSSLRRNSFDFPLGIRPWPKELRLRGSRFKEGYHFAPLENSADSFRLTAMAGAHKIQPIFQSFARTCFPEECFLILEFYQEEWEGDSTNNPQPPSVYYSPYLETGEILETLSPYWLRLVHDGFVGFGLANNRLGMELFYSEEKALSCFTGNHIMVMDLLNKQGLRHNPHLILPSDFGHDHLSLQCLHRHFLPPELSRLSKRELDYTVFCRELTDQFEMYPVEESISFFLSKKEQDLIQIRLEKHPEFSVFAEEDFGALILDWNDFVEECERRFEGDLWEYQQGLKLRDLIQFVIEGMPPGLHTKLVQILTEPDQRFAHALIDRRKRLDRPGDVNLCSDRFWYQGVVRNQGAPLRRDLIRQGWYQPGMPF